MTVACDIGTMNVVGARLGEDGKICYRRERDVFIELPTESNDAKAFLDMAGTKLVTFEDKNYYPKYIDVEDYIQEDVLNYFEETLKINSEEIQDLKLIYNLYGNDFYFYFKSEYIDRKIFEVPETLHTMLKEKLTAEEYAYYTTKAGSRWFAKRFGEFCLVNI